MRGPAIPAEGPTMRGHLQPQEAGPVQKDHLTKLEKLNIVGFSHCALEYFVIQKKLAESNRSTKSTNVRGKSWMDLATPKVKLSL